MKNCKTLLLALTVVAGVLVSRPALASLYSFTGPDVNGTYTSGTIAPNQVIPDNSPVGASYGFNFADPGLSISAVTLTVNMSGGYNGDMNGYLQHGGTLIELFNPGSFSAGGASGSAINITLASGSNPALNTATAANLSAGSLTYAAAGDLNNFNGADPGGLWTLYFADQSPGDVMTLNSFNLSVTAVPEPVSLALVVFGGLLLGVGVVRRYLQSRKAPVN